ncbi:HesA/MoeB/ThiF family protein [Timonella senegalensis]|uniref:HesA/MoeB/ThiF family protein n=1 Tax=Timonella senegalensis TaxID=1465825 RepID=UPI002FDD3228
MLKSTGSETSSTGTPAADTAVDTPVGTTSRAVADTAAGPATDSALSTTASTSDLTPAERVRYARHLTLPGFGVPGQLALRSARVLAVGAGGLGSPALQYLAAAGVGRITVIDDDVVDVSNLQRQTIHGSSNLGQLKVDSAAATMRDINPLIMVNTVSERLTVENVATLVAGADLVLDGTDNFSTRYLLNDVCVALGVPYVWAAIFQFDAQLSVFAAEHGPCLRCVFPSPPPQGSVPSCAEGGVLGVLPGLVGTTQAFEAIKILASLGEPLVGTMGVFDGLSGQWEYVPVAQRPGCVCDPCDRTSVAEALARSVEESGAGSAAACAFPATSHSTTPRSTTQAPHSEDPEPTQIPEATAAQLIAGEFEDSIVLDVRTAAERAAGCIPGSEHIPLDHILTLDPSSAESLGLESSRPVLLYCAAGVRSMTAAQHLAALGFERVTSLRGGIAAYWEALAAS